MTPRAERSARGNMRVLINIGAVVLHGDSQIIARADLQLKNLDAGKGIDRKPRKGSRRHSEKRQNTEKNNQALALFQFLAAVAEI